MCFMNLTSLNPEVRPNSTVKLGCPTHINKHLCYWDQAGNLVWGNNCRVDINKCKIKSGRERSRNRADREIH
jgi:hypothetical protein